ncbi:MAG: LysR family transcriptional regulator [Acidaminococcus intestini]|uniref:LysR family transcriptional regulator n=1 Tax=Acidaminococcus intestini TaxID=187327 RepID=A0A943I528_9FIRM|nr:LysR family transcriptional regulator [Acidaminococcus intestini]
MELKDFTYLQAIAQHKTVSKAAESLFISQPALTLFLKKLESELGLKLFKRINKKMYPTHAGELILKAGRAHNSIQYKLENTLRHVRDGSTGSFTIAITSTRGYYVLPVILPLFKIKYPKYKINILERSVSEVESALEYGTADLAIYSSPRRNKRFTNIHVNTEEVILCISSNIPNTVHTTNKKKFKFPWIDICELGNEHFFINDPQQWRIGQISQDIITKYGLTPETTILRSLDTCLALASRGLGLSFSFDICTKYFNNYEEKPLFLSFGDAPILSEFLVAMRNDHHLVPAEKYFISLLLSNFCDNKQDL